MFKFLDFIAKHFLVDLPLVGGDIRGFVTPTFLLCPESIELWCQRIGRSIS